MDIKLHGAEEEPKPGLRNEVYLVCWRCDGRSVWVLCEYFAEDGRSGIFLNNGMEVERDECIGWLRLPNVEED